MFFRRIAILYVYLILETALSSPLQREEHLQNNLFPVVEEQQATFQNWSSTIPVTNSSLSKLNSTSTSRPLFSTYTIVGMAVGGIVAVVGVLALPALLGFTTAGIAATSTAAAMMSSSAVASGGGVAAGSLVALLQSAGVLGVTASAGGLVATASAGTIGASVGFGIGYGAEKFTKSVASFFVEAYNSAHNETVIFFTGNGTNSWKSFANWTEVNVDYAVMKIKNGTIDGWEKVKDGTTDTWNIVSNWTVVNTKKVTSTIRSWTTSSAVSSSTSSTSKIIFISLFYNLISTHIFLHVQTVLTPIAAFISTLIVWKKIICRTDNVNILSSYQ